MAIYRNKRVDKVDKDTSYLDYKNAMKELGSSIVIDGRKKIYSAHISSDGFGYGVNCRSVSKSHVAVLEKDTCEDDLDKDLTVVWNSFLKQYLIVDGQHIFEAKPEKTEWICKVIQGDVNDNEKLTYGCWRYSFTMSGTQRSISFAQRMFALLKEHDMMIKHCGEGSESFVNKMMSRTSGYKLGTFKTYMVLARDMMKLPADRLDFLMARDGRKNTILKEIGMLDSASSKAVEAFKADRARTLNVSFTVKNGSGRKDAFKRLMNLENQIRVIGKKYGILTDITISKTLKDFIDKRREESQNDSRRNKYE